MIIYVEALKDGLGEEAARFSACRERMSPARLQEVIGQLEDWELF
ncbi:hypothetical protein [Nocardia sp. JMUB6875]